MMPTDMNQAREALAEGNAKRLAQADTRRSISALPIAESCERAADILMDPPDEMLTYRVGRLLAAVRGIGRQRAHRLMHRADLPDSRMDARLCDLTPRQRNALAGVLLARGQANSR